MEENKGIISKIRDKLFNSNKKSFMLTVGTVGLWVNLLASTALANSPSSNQYEETASLNTISENIKRDKLEEYKQIFLKDKNLKLVYSEQELSEKINKNISGIHVVDRFSTKSIDAGYNTKRGIIAIEEEEIKEGHFEDLLFHEVTHAVFTRSETETGFAKGVVGDSLNEGATEYIATKIMEDTNYKMVDNYSKNVRIFSMLCGIYGEQVMFNALKEGPHKLAKMLQKDGVSYNELTGIMDEFLKVQINLQDLESNISVDSNKSALHKEYENLYSRANKIVFELAKKKYKQADLNGKLEMADRIKEIQYEQASKSRNMANASSYMFNDGRTASQVGVNDLGPLVDLVTDAYGLYLNSKQLSIGDKIETQDVRAIHTAMQTLYLSNNNISIKDMDQIELQAVKDGNGEKIAYVIRNDKGILNILAVQQHADKTEIYGFPAEGLGKFLSNKTLENIEKISEIALKYNADESSVFLNDYGFNIPLERNETRMGDTPNVLMFLNNKSNTTALTYSAENGRYERLSVEDVCRFGDVLKDRNQGILENAKAKVGNVLNHTKKPLKLNAGEETNVKTSDVLEDSGKKEKNDFVENIRQAMKERETEEQATEESNFFIDNMKHEMELQQKQNQQERGEER